MSVYNRKESRYNLIINSLQNRIIKLREDLAYDLRCDPKQISKSEWENYIDEHLKKPLDDFWGDEDVAYYLFDKLIEETASISSYPPNSVKQCLNAWQI